MILRAQDTICIVCGELLTQQQSLSLRCDLAGSDSMAVVHADCVSVLDRAVSTVEHHAVAMLHGVLDGKNRRFELPVGSPDDAPIFHNGLCLLDGIDFLRIGRMIVFHLDAPERGDYLTSLLEGQPA